MTTSLGRAPTSHPLDDDRRRHAAGGAHGHEAALQAAWDGWSMAERRAWLRAILHHVTVLPAPPDAHHRGSDVEARLDPQWKV